MFPPLRKLSLVSPPTSTVTRRQRQCLLMVSVGLGPPPKEPGQKEDDDPELQFIQSLSEMLVTEEGRTAEMSQFDRDCDEWFDCLLRSNGGDSSTKYNLPKQLIEKMQSQLYYKILPQDVYEEYIHDKTNPLWSPYIERHLKVAGEHENSTARAFTPSPGLERFGLPMIRRQSEAWRHFDVGHLISTRYFSNTNSNNFFQDEAVIQAILSSVSAENLGANFCWLSDDECTARLVYVDGQFCPTLSKEWSGLARNVQASELSIEEENKNDNLVHALLHLPDGFTDEIPSTEEKGRKISTLSGPDHAVGKPHSRFAINGQQGTAAFCALNTLKCSSIAVVDVPEYHIVDKPILILNAYTSVNKGSDGIAYHPRVIVMSGKNSSINLIQAVADVPIDREVNAPASPRMHNGYTQFFIESQANVSHAYVDESGGMVAQNLEQDNITITAGREAENARPASRNLHMECINVQHTAKFARYKGTIVAVGGNGRSRTCVSSSLAHHACHASISGLLLSGGTQRNDMRTTVHHMAQGTTADQIQKNLVGGRATATFKGRIRVEQDAQQTDAKQLIRTVLTTDKCRIWAMPSLEIIADDVKCTHGATVSDLSEEEMFYLNARGLNADSARSLLMFAFVNEVLLGADKLPKSIVGDERFGLRKRLMSRLYNMTPKGKRAVMGEFQSI